jgi:hypothetical protein
LGLGQLGELRNGIPQGLSTKYDIAGLEQCSGIGEREIGDKIA